MTAINEAIADTCCVFSTELGWMAAVWSEGRLAAFTFDHASALDAVERVDGEPTEDLPSTVQQFQRRMRAYARGHRDDFLDIPLDDGRQTAFQGRVVSACRRIPWGQTLSYADLAELAGSPNAARAVGNVMANNRFPLIVPCHRVVGSAGALGGFSSPNGLDTKRRLLDRECGVS